MRRFKKSVYLTLVAGVALIAAPALYAQGDQAPSGQKTDQPTMQGGMMGQGGMGGMMNMMQQMSQMMEQCNKMMSEHRSHEHDNKSAPATEKNG